MDSSNVVNLPQDTVCIENLIISNSNQEVNYLLKDLMYRDDFYLPGYGGAYHYHIIVNDSLEIVDVTAISYNNQDISKLIQARLMGLKVKPIIGQEICSLNELPLVIQIRTKTISYPDSDDFYNELLLKLGAD
jgi:hypothetical protein